MLNAPCIPRIASSPFSAILHAAAGRAWSRTISSLPNHHNNSKKTARGPKPSGYLAVRDTDMNQSPPQSAHIDRHFSLPRTVSSSPQNQVAEGLPFFPHDTGDLAQQSTDVHSIVNSHNAAITPKIHDVPPPRGHDHYPSTAAAFTPASRFLRPLTHPRPESRKTLYRNLQRSSWSRISLPRLIDYHDRYPELRSTRSFNFLIALALRYSSFGTVQWLFRAMEIAQIPHNVATQKLVVRWLVSTGFWDRAWRLVSEAKALDQRSEVARILWMEFFNGLARGVGFRRLVDREDRTTTESRHPLMVYGRRFVLLVEEQPVLSCEDSRQRVLHHVIHALLQLRQPEHASSLTKEYLNTLSRPSSPFPMKLVHLHVAFGSLRRGLPRFHEARKILMSFLFTYPFLRPTPSTLFLLLGKLRTVQRCGTLAWDTYIYFRRRWGEEVDDQRVRRRVVSLAVKEGRFDIVERILKRYPVEKALVPRVESDSADTRKGKGMQKQKWIRLLSRRQRRIRKLVYRRSDFHNGDITSLG
ncbi:hypothetical protein Moror_942 [Moniliophthora roreri MCA 2997]|uniref:Uncharacterized protein n=1 Tax=Moniliophthora roreri (strain MCA 2997) TaxID=1381753 RepID=V2Z214_MONRO|nr:hypothetical protein Moror_942 [Moniliophthora roreri MCA 2997]